ncbi:MAG: tyrosine-type recombinase/integrase [Fusobacterium sp.]|nr:tyrosine-type recombinase/integrase [Fusobacterium sp.]
MNIVEPIRNKEDLRKIEHALAAQNLRDLLFFVMGTNSGLRISDILNLNVGDVKDKTHITIIEKKTKKYKKFPINEKLQNLIEIHTKNRKNKEPLFKTVYDNRLDRHQAYRIINNVCKDLGIEYKVGTHSLRKTFGYHHYIKFNDIALLQKILNHSSTSITLRYIGIEQDKIDESYMNFIL